VAAETYPQDAEKRRSQVDSADADRARHLLYARQLAEHCASRLTCMINPGATGGCDCTVCPARSDGRASTVRPEATPQIGLVGIRGSRDEIGDQLLIGAITKGDSAGLQCRPPLDHSNVQKPAEFLALRVEVVMKLKGKHEQAFACVQPDRAIIQADRHRGFRAKISTKRWCKRAPMLRADSAPWRAAWKQRYCRQRQPWCACRCSGRNVKCGSTARSSSGCGGAISVSGILRTSKYTH